MRGRDVKEKPYAGHLAQLDGTLKQRNSLGDGTAAEGDDAQAPVGSDEAAGMIDLAGDPESLLAAGHRFRELAQLSEAPGEPHSRAD